MISVDMRKRVTYTQMLQVCFMQKHGCFQSNASKSTLPSSSPNDDVELSLQSDALRVLERREDCAELAVYLLPACLLPRLLRASTRDMFDVAMEFESVLCTEKSLNAEAVREVRTSFALMPTIV